MARIPVGVLGATGAVGQHYVTLLDDHPYFKVVLVAASPASAGKSYAEAVAGKWSMDRDIPDSIRGLIVKDASSVADIAKECRLVFSAIEGQKDWIKELEIQYAAAGLGVVSNNSAHRWTDWVPMIIPEINHQHLDIIQEQRKTKGWKKGFIVVKPNCSLQSYLTPVHALLQAGYPIKRIIVTTEQASSGAGYPGVPSLDLIDNVVPFIGGEEEKTELEPHKILGLIRDGMVVSDETIAISANCTRVPVTHGHLAAVNIEFAGKVPELDEIKRVWRAYSSYPQKHRLPFAPEPAIIYREEENRPQPRKDRDAGKGMAVVVGRLRKCPVFHVKFIGLSHNIIRGAAGGAILTAEMLVKMGYAR
jgi:aspartate-semialdehyde dehydrogenase